MTRAPNKTERTKRQKVIVLFRKTVEIKIKKRKNKYPIDPSTRSVCELERWVLEELRLQDGIHIKELRFQIGHCVEMMMMKVVVCVIAV